MSNFSLEQLTEGIRQRNQSTTNKTVVEKWNRTGLLRGLSGVHRDNMAQLLENQASQVLKEAASLGGEQVRGFTNVAFPIVRRVFGGLIANELVSIQPMSLPSGLLFYMDYTYGSNVGPYKKGDSLYSSPNGKGIAKGSDAVGGLYDLAAQSYTKVPATATTAGIETGHFNAAGALATTLGITRGNLEDNPVNAKLLQYDPQIVSDIEALVDPTTRSRYSFAFWKPALADKQKIDATQVKEITLKGAADLETVGLTFGGKPIQNGDAQNVRRLTQIGLWDAVAETFTPDPFADVADPNWAVLFVVYETAGNHDATGATATFPLTDTYQSDATDGTTLVVPSFESDFGTTPSPEIPEIDIKVEAVPVVATTRKLRARWSPELAQDLNAYHSLDAEVELTQILSEQIALEIDREILNDLLTQATAANYYWSRSPGKFLNKETGVEVAAGAALGPVFKGTVREWYETLTETIIDVANQIHRKTLRGSANFIVVGPDVATVLESSVMYKPVYTLDNGGQVGSMTIGAEKVGSLSNRFTVYKDPYFPRNKVLVGYKGNAYLESGYVYAPYVPLIVTPTIFAPEDFTPRKGVMTRYGKKMVRADFFGTVTCLDMNVI